MSWKRSPGLQKAGPSSDRNQAARQAIENRLTKKMDDLLWRSRSPEGGQAGRQEVVVFRITERPLF